MALRKSNFRVFVMCCFYILYLVIGAAIFSAIEGPEERHKVRALKKVRDSFLNKNKECMSDAELEDFIIEIISANNRGVSAARNVTGEPNWSFGQSMFFAGTILTTIGYGHVTPLSEGGKVFCIVYAAIGIPLTLIMFTALVERLMILTEKLLIFLTDKLGRTQKTLHIRLLHVSIIFIFVITTIFIIPSTIFFFLETDWNYLDAFYYCFISMTTIGLGDYIPGDDPDQKYRPLYKIATTFYLFIGLVFMMLTLANVYDVPELNIGYHFYLKSDEQEDDEQRYLRAADTQSGPKYTPQTNEAYQGDAKEENTSTSQQ